MSRARQLALDAVAVAVCAALASLYLTRHFVDGDEGIFAAAGQRMAMLDLPPYLAGWEHKPPAIFWTYSTFLGQWPGGGMLALHALSAAALVLTGVIAGIGAVRLLGRAAFAPTVVIYGLLRSFGEAKSGAANTEAFQAPFIAMAILLFVSPSARPMRSAFLAGAFLGVAVLFKPPAALLGPASVIAVFALRGWRAAWTSAWAGGLACVAVLGVAAAKLGASGVLAEGWWLSAGANRIYMEFGPPQPLGAVLRGFVGEPMRAAAPWVLALGAAFLVMLRPRTFGEPTAVRRAAVAVAVLLVVGVLSAGLGGYFFRHYWWPLYPVLAVAAAAGVVGVLAAARQSGKPSRVVVAVIAIAAVLGALWVPAQWVDKRRLLRSPAFDGTAEPPYESATVRAAADAVRGMTADGDTVFVWGSNPELYLLSGRPSATRHIVCAFLTGTLRYDVRMGTAPPDPDLVPGAWDLLDQDLDASRPRVIVDTSRTGYRRYDLFPVSKFPRIAARLARDYELTRSVDGYDLYLRR